MIEVSLALWIAASLTSGSSSLQEEPEPPSPPPIVLKGDAHRRYILHAPPAGTSEPKEGWKLLVVMPGGSGDADFAPFVGRIRANALDDDWLVAQLIAPVWDEKQAEALVWPTKLSPWPKMEFACEEFFDEVVAHVAADHALDPRFLFTLSWSSGGPLGYTLALRKDTRVTGTFVAMSVFKPAQLPSLKPAKGRCFYVLHSEEDFIPFHMAEAARDDLGRAGAEVTLATYAGGHGWHGDVYGNLRAGFAWLEERAARGKAPKAPRAPKTRLRK